MELVVFDLDGTLLNKHQALSPFTLETLEAMRDKKIFYTIATGRTHLAARKCLVEHNFQEWMIFKNGVEWWHPLKKQYRHQTSLTKESVEYALTQFELASVTPFIFCITRDGTHKVYHPPVTSPLSDLIENELGKHDELSLHPIQEMAFDDIATNISALGSQQQAVSVVTSLENQNELKAYCGGGVYNKDTFWIDVHHQDACKGSAINTLKSELGATKVLAFGDGDNDLSMFDYADASFAPHNAAPHVKSRATDVIGHHNEDGVAHFLRDYFSL
ncbi:HAD-IIB family hydrolase [Marinomonas mediterranea]|uniref:HAD-superfamily hydrolase, subfamily IIB n=1 Tax=Marinomonas mediterranea (strain ATCC 700492 / JCM 21426 / NBRC 103028 / MMB-1) TaxID=717774 RepID=F2JVT2_MARM1|nr:HAD family hydrolase [Marinomonas mediterranea]ADZ91718.1 HAD-superfamily hydrolase, subfamily IIB [Marinomonas mediterranea MMB-1]WCN13759.1 HAD-IIB family hydrolase [Marinomonas mediterranea]WCN17814.1 HAD-IIB family hydrolase [Marinomonas mediterranea MMB-1]